MKNSLLVTALLLTLIIIFAGCTEEMETINQPDDYPDLPISTWFLDIQGTAADDIWIAGQPGVLMHFDGTNWSLEDHGDVTLTNLYSNTTGTTFVCGHSGTIMKNSGSGWSDMSTGIDLNLYGIGKGPYGDIFVCGQGGALLKLNGSSWDNTPDEIFWISQNDTILRSSDDIESFKTINKYAIGGSDAILLVEAHPDSTHQYWVKGPIEASLGEWIIAGWTDEQAIDNNWLVGAEGHLYRLLQANDELSYVETSSPGGDHTNLPDLTDIWVDENNSCWFTSRGGQVFKRTPMVVVEDPDYLLSSEDLTFDVSIGTSLDGIWGTSANDIWVVGYGGAVFHFDGTDWSQQDVPLPN